MAVAAVVLGAAGAGCSSSPIAGGDDAGDDTVTPFEDIGGADIGTWDGSDDGADDGSGDAGTDADDRACETDRECEVGVCVDLGGVGSRGFCAAPCLDDRNCVGGEACILLINSGGDGVSVCVPIDYCTDGDDDRFGVGPGCLGIDCDDTDPTINIGADEICDGVDNDCNDAVDESVLGIGVPCVTGFPGRCSAGLTACVAGLTTCDPIETGVEETCNGVDDDCDGTVDEEPVDGDLWYPDFDEDGFGDADDAGVRACRQPRGTVSDHSDCDDRTPSVNPDAVEVCDHVDNDCRLGVDEQTAVGARAWYPDADEDGYGDPDAPLQACWQPEGHVGNADDCDDGRDDVHPDVPETCDGVDNNCVDGIDEPAAIDAGTWYADLDRDGFGDPASALPACERPAGRIAVAGDCDDSNDRINPDATEVCDGVDNDCVGGADEPTAVGASTWYRDSDGDGYGDPSLTTLACSKPDLYAANATDCDDRNRLIHPGATEVCDALDNNCVNGIDEPTAVDATTWYRDNDRDSWGVASVSVRQCSQPAGYVARAGDCDDDLAVVNPRATEVCNTQDDDCDGAVDEGVKTTFFRDADGDRWGNAASTTAACVAPPGYVTNDRDCDDTNPRRNPGQPEVCDGLDNNCDGTMLTVDRRGRTVEYFFGCQNYGTANADDRCYGEAWNGQGYMHCHYPATFDVARSVCGVRGMDLVDLNGATESSVVMGTFDGQDGQSWDDLWLGGRENGVDGNFTWLRSGILFWARGTTGQYTRWRSGQPNDDTVGGSGDCVSARQADYNWDDRPCGEALEFICEW